MCPTGSSSNQQGRRDIGSNNWNPSSPSKGRVLAERQGTDPQLGAIVQYLKDGILPPLEKEAKELALIKDWYMLVDNIIILLGMVPYVLYPLLKIGKD